MRVSNFNAKLRRVFINPNYNVAKVVKRSAITTAAVGLTVGRAPWALSLVLFSILEIPGVKRGLQRIKQGWQNLIMRLPFFSKDKTDNKTGNTNKIV